MLRAKIDRQHLTLCNTHAVADTIDYLEMSFRFTQDWDGAEKWAHFSNGSTIYDVLLTNDEIRKEDHLNLSSGTWRVYVHGNRFAEGKVVERITTDVARMYVNPTGMLEGEPLPEVPASEAELLRAEMADLREDAEKLAENSAESAASAQESATAAQESATAATNAATSAIASANTAISASNSAKASADHAEQVAVKNGYVEFELSNEDGILYLYRTDNIVDEIDFILDENTGELEVEIT